MKIYDMQEETFKILDNVGELKTVATDYPKSWNDFPMAIYRTKRKPHFVDFDKQELQSQWKITIEVYGDDETGDLTPIVEQISKKFNQIGFKGDVNDANTAGMTRVICEFSAIVDNVTFFVYSN